MLKVLHLISSLRRGGRERQLSVILKVECENVLNFAIVFNKFQNSYEQEYNLGAKLIYLQLKNPISRFFEMYRIIKNKKPDILWSWGGFEATFGLLLAYVTPVKHINGSIRHGIVLFNRKQIWRLMILHLSKYIVANSKTGLRANKLKRGMVLYNGLDERFFGIVDKQQFLLQNNEINSIKQSGILIFTSVANLVPYKDYFTIFKALEQLKNKGYQFYYLIIGEGPDRSAIENDIREKDLEKNVVLLGRRHDVKEILSISDVFIHSSRGEGCSNAIIEAMASALPVVATDTGGTNEIVQSDHGFLFDYGDHQTLVRCLTEIMEKPELLLKMGSISRERAMKFFSTERMVDEFNKIVQEVSGQKIDKPKDNI